MGVGVCKGVEEKLEVGTSTRKLLGDLKRHHKVLTVRRVIRMEPKKEICELFWR